MRHRGKQVFLQPLALGEHSFLMTARAEVADLAGAGQQVVVPALITINADKATVEVAAGQETLEHL